jgi:hypothetical protein
MCNRVEQTVGKSSRSAIASGNLVFYGSFGKAITRQIGERNHQTPSFDMSDGMRVRYVICLVVQYAIYM